MTKSYKKNCMYCNQEITMSDQSGKWLPYNKDGNLHDCRTKTNTNGKAKQEQQEAPAKQNNQQQQQQQETSITIKQLKIWLARLEKAGVHIDINSILNPKQDQDNKEQK